MELKNFFAQDDQGNKLPGATCYLYQRGTQSPVGGLLKANGEYLSNPFAADQDGLIQFAAPNGLYDVRVVSDARDYRIRMQFNDVAETLAAAESAAARAETARDAAQLSVGIFDDVADGLRPESTVSGQYFSVLSAYSNEYLILYKNSAGVAIEVKRYPSAAFLAPNAPLGAVWSVQDAAGNAAIEILDDGTFRAGSVRFDHQLVGSTDIEEIATPGYVWSVRDADGNIAAAITFDGKLEANLASVPGSSVPLVERFGGVYPAQLSFIATQGQSLAGGSDSAITTTQEYDNIGFKAMSNSPTATYPLTVANTQTTQTGENPMYGTAGHLKALIEAEQGLSYTVNDYQILSCCNGSSGAPIDEINKGGSRGMFERAISQAVSGKALASSTGRTFLWQAVTWTQGESDSTMPKDIYKAKLKQLAKDFNTDGKVAAGGQSQDILFVSYQLSAYAARDTIAPAQLEASEEVSYIKVATPIYFMDFYDGTHLKGQSSKWLGGYYGLVIKRILVDEKDWQPLKPIQHAVTGNTIDLYFNKQGLVFDTTAMPAQVNQGFTVFDGAGVAISISSVAILSPSRVRLSFATAPQAGWRVKYGHISVIGKTNYTGGGGNLRDSAGDQLVYAAIGKPMHNWSVIFNYAI